MIKTKGVTLFSIFVLLNLVFAAGVAGQDSGDEHSTSIYGVEIGMDVPTALEAVFVNANRKTGEEKPDAMRREGKDDKDIRVIYKELPLGELQIVFALGKYVSQIILTYKEKKSIEDLRLAPSSDVGTASSGIRYDDRYTVGFVDSKKQEKLWWRDEKTQSDYAIRVSFLSENLLKDSSNWWQTILRKGVTVKPGDEKKIAKALEKNN